MQWQKIVLHNLCEVTSSKRIYASEYQSEGIPFYRGKEISEKYNGNIDVSTELFITESKYNEIKDKFGVPQAGDLLLTSVGTLGNPYVVSEGEVFYFKDGNLTWFKDFKGMDSKYLFYWLVSPQGKAELKKCTIGSSQSAFTIVLLKEMQIALPPLPVQHRIADILSAYDDLIENNTRRIRILEEMAQAIYQEWFGTMDKEFLPKGWEEKTLGDIAHDIRRNVHPNDIDSETPYFGLEHLPRKSIALSEWGKAGDVQSTKLAFKKGEILFGKIRPYFHKVGVAPLDGVASSDTIIIAPKSQEYFGLVLGCVFSEGFVNHATQTSQGTKMPRANWDVLVKYPILVPPKPVLEQFNQTINDFVDLIQNLLFRNRNLRQTRDLLLPRLVSGEIEV